MTHKEAVLISAYTGYLLVKDISDVIDFNEKLLGKSIFSDEFLDKDIKKLVHEKCEPLIIDMINNEDLTRCIKVEDVNNIIDSFDRYLDKNIIHQLKYRIKKFVDTVVDV